VNSKSDAELVSLAQEGSQPALQELFERHYTRIFGICRRMLRSEDDACDATQEVFLSIVRHLKNFSGEATFKTWAYRITVNACKDELSKRKTRPVLSPEDDLLEPESTGAAAGDVAHIVVDVQAALAQLGEEYRTAIVLREQAELSYEEIARMLEVPVGTVRSRIARGRAELTRLLKLGESDASEPSKKPKSKTRRSSKPAELSNFAKQSKLSASAKVENTKNRGKKFLAHFGAILPICWNFSRVAEV